MADITDPDEEQREADKEAQLAAEEEEQQAPKPIDEQAQQPATEEEVAPEYRPADTGRPTFLPNVRPTFLPDIRHEHPSVTGTDRPVFLPHIRTDVSEEEGHVTPVPLSQYGVAPRALTPAILAARQTAEQYGGDFSQRAQRAGAVGASEQQAQQFAATAAAPTTTPENEDLVGKSFQNFYQNILASNAELNKAAAQQQLSQKERTVFPYEEQVQRAREDQILNDPNTSREEADDIISRRNAREAQLKTDAQKELDTQQANLDAAKKAMPDEAFQNSPLGHVSRVAGSSIPYVVTGALGPFAPLAVRTQMAESSYSSTFDRAKQQLKTQHPDWSEDQLNAAANIPANQAGAEAAKSAVLFDIVAAVPVAGPLVSRIAQRIGWSAATMEITNVYNQVQANAALKKTIDPNQDLLDGLRTLDSHVESLVSGAAFAIPHAVGEIGKPTEVKPGVTPPQVTTPPVVTPPPVVPPPVVKPEIGERGAPIRGAETKTLTESPKVEPPVQLQPQAVQPTEPVVPPVVTPPAVTERPVFRPTEPIVAEPVQPEPVRPREVVGPETDEAELHRQTDELYNRNRTEVALTPIEEQRIAADIRQSDEALRQERAGALQPERLVGEPIASGETRVPPVQEPVRPDVGGERALDPGGRVAPGGEGTVQPELGRVQGLLERPLSPEQKRVFAPEVKALQDAPPNPYDPTFREAFRNLREKVISRFQDVLDAAGINRRPDTFGAHMAAEMTLGGDQYLQTNLERGARAMENALSKGIDPVDLLHSQMQEELIHLAHHAVLRNEWIAGGRQGELADHFHARTRELFQNLISARDEASAKGNRRLAVQIDTALHRSWPLYEGGVEHFNKAGLDRALADSGATELMQRASELVRQITQIESGNPLTESHAWTRAWRIARAWLAKVKNHLVDLARQLGPGKALAKTELARMVHAVDAQIKRMDETARAYREGRKPPAVTAEAPGRGIVAEAPAAPKRRKTMADWLARYSMAVKGGESAMLDFKETQPLAVALRRKSSEVQRIGQQMQLTKLKNAFDQIPGRSRDRVTKEFTDYIQAEQNKQPLPVVGTDTMRMINAAKDSLERAGGVMKALNVHVKDGDVIRPARQIGRSYFPRMISDDTRDIFNNRNGDRAGDFNRIVNEAIAKGVVTNRDEFIDKFTHAISGEPGSNDHFGNVEKARRLDLPLSFYDFSPQTLIRYLGRANERLAQISSFGQKLGNKGKDLFDKATEEVNQSGAISHDTKNAIIDRIAKEAKAEYQRNDPSVLGQAGSNARQLASGAFLGNPQTSLNNFITGAAQNFVFGGPGSFLRTAARFPFNWRSAITEARDRNILRTNLKDVLHDYDLATDPGWLSKGISRFTQASLKYGGQDLTENLNRTFAMQQGKVILQDFLKDHGTGKTNPLIRSRNDFILRRFGVSDPAVLNQLAHEGGAGPLTDEFLRQYVMDVHGNYGPSQAPAHLLDSPAGKVLFQFQKWGANTTRMATREFLMPLTRAVKSGNPADIGYQFLRNVGYLSSAVGFGVAAQAAVNAMYRRDSRDPTFAEIGKAVSQGRNADAIQWALKRAWGAFILSGFSGLVGNYVDMIQSNLGTDSHGRLKDPSHPPAWGIIEPFFAFFKGWYGENGFRGPPSLKLAGDLGTSVLSGYRSGQNIAMALGSSVPQLRNGWPAEYAAKQDSNFTRNRIGMFEDQYPALQEKRAQAGTRQLSISMAGRGPFDPTRDQIINGLISGNVHQVGEAIRNWLETVPKTEVPAELNRIKNTISSNSPLKIGGSTKPEVVMDFLGWAKNNLPEGEARRIFAFAQTYAKTALATGLEDRSRETEGLARLDYDKFRAPRPVPPAVAAAAERAQQAKGEAQLRAVIARQKVAERLQGH